ncbi:hypothetical protein PP178_05270 [Zeaxanthinibacter sp. PT1]|uniref:hypothetical protein n=1 Tax=Zeaxanthinibacter TaxID=561554 RepID=UPI00234AF2E7|nr:hypothetical protein [Zeaxanthinibacter sp. PT1]MDC6350953.1 hypothetical protein [Zeaxanthinibacter sp. PT1]
MGRSPVISSEIAIAASTAHVWDVITNPDYARILGNAFDKNAYLESDWELGSKVHFKYSTGGIVATGVVAKRVDRKLIQVDYNFDGMAYVEKFTLSGGDYGSNLQVFSGPHGQDFEAQKVVWKNWLQKVKELSEE